MANGQTSTTPAADPDLGMSVDQFLAPRPGEAGPIQAPPQAPGQSLGDIAGRYGEAFKRGAIYASPVAAGTLALGAATGPGFLASVPAALGEEFIGGLGGVAEQGVNDLRSYTGANIPQWVGPAVGAGIGFTSAGARLAGAGVKAIGSAVAGGAAGFGVHASGAIPDILKIAGGDALANTVLHGGLFSHMGAITATAAGAATMYGLYSGLRGIGRIAEGTWDAISRPLAGYMGTGQYAQPVGPVTGAVGNALTGNAAGSTAPSPANTLGGLLFGTPPAPAGTPPPEWTGNTSGSSGMTITAPRDFQDPRDRTFVPPPQ